MANEKECGEAAIRTLLGWDEGTEGRDIYGHIIDAMNMAVSVPEDLMRAERLQLAREHVEQIRRNEEAFMRQIVREGRATIMTGMGLKSISERQLQQIVDPKPGQVYREKSSESVREAVVPIDDGVEEALRRLAPEERETMEKGLREGHIVFKPEGFCKFWYVHSFPSGAEAVEVNEVEPEVPVKVKAKVNLFTAKGDPALEKGRVYEVIMLVRKPDGPFCKILDGLGRYIDLTRDEAREFLGEEFVK